MSRPPRSLFHFACLAIAALSVTAPTWAGTVYLPPLNVEGFETRTDLWLTNTTNAPLEISTQVKLVQNDGGSEMQPTNVIVAPNNTFRLRGINTSENLGAIEIDLPDGALATARLVTIHPVHGEILGTEIPLVTRARMASAGDSVHILAWEREDGERITDLGLINLSGEESECLVSVFRGNGQQVNATAILSVDAESSRYFPDALAILGQNNIGIARVRATCDRPFYAYSILTDLNSGEVSFLPPSAQGKDGLTPPGEAPECAPNAVQCWVLPGNFHVPSPSNPVAEEAFYPTPGRYSKLRVRLSVRLDEWFPGSENKTHNIFWLVRDRKNKDMYGYVNVKGPDSNSIFNRHDFNTQQGDKAKESASLFLQTGSLYHFEYIYDTAGRTVETIVSDAAGVVLVHLFGTPNINRINHSGGESIDMDFGFPLGANPNEPPTYGWEYKNLVVELFD